MDVNVDVNSLALRSTFLAANMSNLLRMCSVWSPAQMNPAFPDKTSRFYSR